MKFLFVIPRMSGGGAERVIANLSNKLVENNMVKIVTLVSNTSFYELDKRVYLSSANIKIKRNNKIVILWYYFSNFFRALFFIKNEIKKYGPDCIVSFLPETDILTFLACFNKKNITKVFSERNDPTQRNIIFQKILSFIYGHSDLFVCQGKKVFDYYDKVNKNKKVIIPNPLNESFINCGNFIEKELNIVSVGRFFKQKNFPLLIRSFAKATKRIPNNCKLIIYGDGPLRSEYERLINELDMKERILLPGTIDNPMKKAANYALYVMSSDYEGFPNVLLEAMAVGLPVISTDFNTGIAKELIHNENGILVPINNEDEMTRAIITLINDKKVRDKMREKNTYVRKQFSINIIVNLWCKNIERAMEVKNE